MVEFFPFFKTYAQSEADNLVCGNFPQVRKTIKFVSKCGLLKRGSVIGKTKDGFVPLSKESEPYGVLSTDLDTEKDLSGVIYLTGEFNKKYVEFFGIDQEAVSEKLRNKSIFLV